MIQNAPILIYHNGVTRFHIRFQYLRTFSCFNVLYKWIITWKSVLDSTSKYLIALLRVDSTNVLSRYTH
jgi:hypothetical protein